MISKPGKIPESTLSYDMKKFGREGGRGEGKKEMANRRREGERGDGERKGENCDLDQPFLV